MGTSANRYKLRLTSGEKYINFPLELTSTNISQEEIIENDFVKKETEKAINPIIDYDKIRYIPHIDKFDAGRIDYNLHLLNESGEFPTITTLKTEGYTQDDVRYRRNNFKRSFLNLMFFDSDIPTNQNYIGNITLYNRITRFDLVEPIIDRPPRGTNTPQPDGPRGRGNTTDTTSSDTNDGGFSYPLLSLTFNNNLFVNGCELALQSFYGTTNSLLTTTALYSDSSGSVKAPSGWYSNKVNIRYWNGTTMGEITECPTDGCRDIKGTLSTAAVINKMNPVGFTCTQVFGTIQIKSSFFLDGTNWKVENVSGNNISCDQVHFGVIVDSIKFNGTTINKGVNEEIRMVWARYKINEIEHQAYVIWDTTNWFIKDVYFICTNKIEYSMPMPGSSENGETYKPAEGVGKLKNVEEIPLRFIVEDPIEFPQGFAEGFYIYHPKINLPQSIYMRANFNNAKTGLSTDLMTTPEPQTINEVLKKIHMKYNLKYDSEKYYYEIDTEYSNNVVVTEPLRGSARVGGFKGNINIELYEIQVL